MSLRIPLGSSDVLKVADGVMNAGKCQPENLRNYMCKLT